MELNLTSQAKYILEQRYLRRNDRGDIVETPEQLFERVAKAISDGEDTEENKKIYYQKFYDLMTSLKFLPNSPTLVNAGVEGKGCLSACFVASPQDSLASILETQKDWGLIEKWGGGIGIGLSDIRPKGDRISTTHGKALGPVAIMHILSINAKYITQGSFRLGAHMSQLSLAHDDILEFIHCKDNDNILENFNISVQITDDFMEKLEKNENWSLKNPKDNSITQVISARQLWKEICESAWKTGDPGVVFIDRVWETAPNPQLGKILTSNPCWSGDTLVWTINGPRKFIDLIDQEVPVLTALDDGKMAFRMMRKIRKTEESVKTLKITVEAYRKSKRQKVVSSFILTPSHNLFLVNGTKIEAKDLNIGDRLESVYRNQANQKGYLCLRNSIESDMEHRIVASWDYGTRPKYPEYDVDHIDGNKKNNAPENLRVLNSSYHDAIKMLGVLNPVNRFPEKNSFKYLDFSGKNNGMYGVHRYGDKNPMFGKRKINGKMVQVVNHKVINIEDGPNIDVYNGAVDETHRYYVQINNDEGILSANCGEEFLENYNNCCLGSIDLSKFVKDGEFDFDEFREVVNLSVRFLDDVVNVNTFPMQKLRDMNLKTRRIGLGIMGFADALVKLGAKYDSELGVSYARLIGKSLKAAAWEESAKLAIERGEYPEYKNSALKELHKGIPVRNSSVITLAPTGTISRLAGCSSGCEPFFDLAYWSNILWEDHDGRSSKFLDVPSSVKDELERQFGWEKAKEILVAIANAPEKTQVILKDYGVNTAVFRTAMEISPEWHVKMQAAWQENVTNSVSKTINLPESATVNDVSEAFKLAFELKCKAVTVYRDKSKSIQVLNKAEDFKDSNLDNKKLKMAKERPTVVTGVTEKVKTGHGNAYVTINFEDRQPFELFTALGKAGGCDSSNLEAISRLVSLAFRYGIDTKEVVAQLKGITCCPVWNDGVMIKSTADGIAYAISKNVLKGEAIGYNNKIDGNIEKNVKLVCIKCGGELLQRESCAVCRDCGWEKCG